MWQVTILARLKSDSKNSFALGKLMMKAHNQMANKELGDHIFFEGFEYLGHESEVKGLVGKKDGLPVFEVVLGTVGIIRDDSLFYMIRSCLIARKRRKLCNVAILTR